MLLVDCQGQDKPESGGDAMHFRKQNLVGCVSVVSEVKGIWMSYDPHL